VAGFFHPGAGGELPTETGIRFFSFVALLSYVQK
jgi:hypothetical protein